MKKCLALLFVILAVMFMITACDWPENWHIPADVKELPALPGPTGPSN